MQNIGAKLTFTKTGVVLTKADDAEKVKSLKIVNQKSVEATKADGKTETIEVSEKEIATLKTMGINEAEFTSVEESNISALLAKTSETSNGLEIEG